ncbi:MAG: tetratricopeptide repeat protein [Trueperaceae bacterium]
MSAPDATAPDAAPQDPLLSLAKAGDWRTLARLGRFGLAGRTLRLAGGSESDDDTADTLEALAEIEVAVRTKAVARARRRFAGLERRPSDWIDWDAVESDLEQLAIAVPAVDRREPEAARAALAEMRSDVFTAEREILLGTLAVIDGDETTGLVHFEAGLARDPNHVRGLTNRGNVKLEAGDVDGAIEDYERAIRVDEGFANAHHNLGVAYRRKGQIGKSVAALRRAQRHAARRDAEDARASLGGGPRGARSGPASGGRLRRWLLIGALGLLAYWLLQQRGLI